MGQPRAQASDARCFGCFSGHGLRTHPLVRIKGYLMAKRPNRLPVIGHEQQQIELLKRMTPNDTPEEYRVLSNGLADVSIAALELVAALEGSRRPNFEVLYDLVDGLADLVGGSDTEDASEPMSQVAAVTSEPVRSASLVAESAVQPISDGASSRRPVAGVSQMKTTIIGRPDRIGVKKVFVRSIAVWKIFTIGEQRDRKLTPLLSMLAIWDKCPEAVMEGHFIKNMLNLLSKAKIV